MIKFLKKLHMNDPYLCLIKAISDKATTNIILDEKRKQNRTNKKPECFPLKSGRRQECRFTLFSILRETLAQAFR